VVKEFKTADSRVLPKTEKPKEKPVINKNEVRNG